MPIANKNVAIHGVMTQIVIEIKQIFYLLALLSDIEAYDITTEQFEVECHNSNICNLIVSEKVALPLRHEFR